ncbi:MAG: hypothetical protein F4Y31_05370 [Gammaproteobacteria bacterium]|nr:hypothetical protein [Gammaproteobacteria bacterium]
MTALDSLGANLAGIPSHRTVFDAAYRLAVAAAGREFVQRIEDGQFEAEQRRLARALIRDPYRLAEKRRWLNDYEREALVREVT